MTTTQTKTCKHCHTSFDITQEDMDFYAKISPKFGDYVAQIPKPTLCPDCRQRRRLAFRNERKLYRRTCDATQKEIISIYSPDKPYTVYDQKVWRGDARDPLDYGRDFDFSRTFTEQFGELMRGVPRVALGVFNSINSGYANFTMNSKDSYLAFSCVDSENVMYSRNVRRSQSIVDCLQVADSESCYGLVIAGGCFDVHYSFHVFSCAHSEYLWYCENCEYCFGCYNMKNKKYCIHNEQYTEDEYFERVRELRSVCSAADKINEMHVGKSCYLEPSYHMINNESVCGDDFIRDSKNVLSSYNVAGSVDLKYALELELCDSCYDCEFGISNDYLIEAVATGFHSSKSGFYSTSTGIFANFYCDYCLHSSHLFGCIGLRNQEYCIFNKQYTKEEYNKLVPRIIAHMKKTGEWGEFFHPSLSPFGYNETVANEYFPLQKDVSTTLSLRSEGQEGIDFAAHGYKWSDYEAPAPHADKIIPAEKLPTDITVIPDDITNRILRCSVSGKPYRIIPQELAFYRKHGLPIPTKHPDVRHEERMKLRR